MNFLDILLGIPLLWLSIRGFNKGFVVEITTLLALLIGIIGAIHFSDYAAEIITNNFSMNQKYVPIVAFAVTFIALVFIITLLGKFIRKILNLIALGFIDKLGGAALGIIKAGFILSVILFVINKIDFNENIISTETKKNSILYSPIEKMAPAIMQWIDIEKLKKFIPIKDENENENSTVFFTGKKLTFSVNH